MFHTQNFSEIVFCAVSSNEQVKVRLLKIKTALLGINRKIAQITY